MDVISALTISVSLAADAMTASVCCGIKSKGKTVQTAIITASMFGIFQMLMSVFGWSIGKVGLNMTYGREGIIGFVILLLLGVKMIFDSRKGRNVTFKTLKMKELLLLSTATSIDALALGTVLPAAVKAETFGSLLLAVLMIGAAAFSLSLLGFILGRRFGNVRSDAAEAVGGVLLILLGLRRLIFG